MPKSASFCEGLLESVKKHNAWISAWSTLVERHILLPLLAIYWAPAGHLQANLARYFFSGFRDNRISTWDLWHLPQVHDIIKQGSHDCTFSKEITDRERHYMKLMSEVACEHPPNDGRLREAVFGLAVQSAKEGPDTQSAPDVVTADQSEEYATRSPELTFDAVLAQQAIESTTYDSDGDRAE